MTAALLTVVLLVAAPAQKGGDPKDEAPDFAGKWEMTKLIVGGENVPLNFVAVLNEFTPDGMRLQRKAEGDPIANAQYFTLDRGAKPPAIDIRQTVNGPVTSRGIYKVDGDTLTICTTVVDPKVARPVKLDAPAGSQFTLSVYTRVKK